MVQTTAPLGVADVTARNLLNGGVRDPHLSASHPFVVAVRRAYDRLPASARPAAVTAAFAWAKAYVNSAAFTNLYAATRQQARPAALPPEELTVDAELKKKLDEERAKVAEMKQAAAGLPPNDRATVLEGAKQFETMLADPATIKRMRDEIEERRAGDARSTSDVVANWNATYPPSPRDFVKRELERFIEVAARVDFTVPITIFRSPDGVVAGFVAPLERPFDSWMDVECLLAGRDMVAAGRAAAQAWLKEMTS
jgi:hypothetical protein